MSPRRSALLLLVSLVLVPAAAARDGETPAPPPCASPEHRQFDFWLGAWRVVDGAGRFQGTNRIEQGLGGCVLEESWTGAGGSRGRSFTIYAESRWHQTWVDDRGLLLRLDGGLVGDSMVLEGTTLARDGATVRHRIRWSPLEDGRVRQHWQTSRDGGATWSDAFDGFYRRMPE